MNQTHACSKSRSGNKNRSFRRVAWAGVLAAGLGAILPLSGASADTVWVASENTNPVPFEGKIREITDKDVILETRFGGTMSRQLDRTRQIAVDGEDAFNKAEQAFVDGKFDQSIDGYAKTVRSTTKPWLKTWAGRRLVEAANQTDRFDAAATAYITLLTQNPNVALQYKPTLPAANSSYIKGAVSEVNAALTGKLSDVQQLALLNFLLEMQRRQDDQRGVTATIDKILKLSAAAGDNPEAVRAIADARLSQANVLIDQKKYADAQKMIQENKANFTEPRQQADALFALAEAKRGLADPTDKGQLADAALAYMRVVAHFTDAKTRPHVSDALMATAKLEEQLGDPTAAFSLYTQVASEFANQPVAKTAATEAARVKPQMPKDEG